MTHLGGGIQGQPRLSGFAGPIPIGGVVGMTFVPATLDRDGICVAQQVAIGANFTITGALITATGSGRATINPTGAFGRCIGVYSASDCSADTVTVYGYDVYGQRLVETIAGPNNTTTAGIKAFSIVDRVKANTAVTDDIEIGTIDKFGLPAYLADLGRVVRVGWTQTLADNASTVVIGVTTTPSATTGDIRGLVTPSSAANGTRELTILYMSPTAAVWYGNGVRQYGAGIA